MASAIGTDSHHARAWVPGMAGAGGGGGGGSDPCPRACLDMVPIVQGECCATDPPFRSEKCLDLAHMYAECIRVYRAEESGCPSPDCALGGGGSGGGAGGGPKQLGGEPGVGGNGGHIAVPPGVGGNGCCCCVEDVVFSSELLSGGQVPQSDPGYDVAFSGSVGNFRGRQGELRIGSKFGLHVVRKVGARKIGRYDAYDAQCSMTWYERTNYQRDLLPALRRWHDLSMRGQLMPGTLPLIDKWESAADNPCDSQSIDLTDEPSLDVRLARGQVMNEQAGVMFRLDPTLDIFVRFRSGGACDCDYKEILVSMRQTIISRGGAPMLPDGAQFRIIKKRGNAPLRPSSANSLPGPYEA